jgi:hypothetical protein
MDKRFSEGERQRLADEILIIETAHFNALS